MPAFLRLFRRKKASSLVTTLFVVTVLTVIVVAFLQSMTIERMTSKSYANIERARLAAEAGVNAAETQLLLVSSNNPAFVIGTTNDSTSQALLAAHTDLTNLTGVVPLISGNFSLLAGAPTNLNANNVQSFLNARIDPSGNTTANLNSFGRAIEQTADANKYRAPWVYITNSQGQNVSRYAFFMVDESSRLNPLFHGDGLSRSNSTNWNPGPGVIPMHIPGGNLLTTNEVSKLRSIATNAPTFSSLAQAFATREDFDAVKHLLSVDDRMIPDVIPNHYPDGGKPKFSINEMATNSAFGTTPKERAEAIAEVIGRNLTNFASRDLGTKLSGLDDELYLNRLAASIVDYIDTDTEPTQANNGEPAGKELAPYVVMVAERNTWVSESASGPPYSIVIRSEFFVQFWNPYPETVSGNLALEVRRRQYVELSSGGPQTDFADFVGSPVNILLQGNEMRTFKMGQVEQTFVHPTIKPSSAPANYPRWPTTSSSTSSLTGHPQFLVFINGSLIDMNRQEPVMEAPANSGLTRSGPGNGFGPVGTARWSFNFCPPNPGNTIGDPRANSLTESDWSGGVNISIPRWQGRQTDTSGRRQDFSAMWVDRDFLRTDIPIGSTLASIGGDPTALASTYTTNLSTASPAFLRNAGLFTIAELGHVFDPAQVNDTGGNVEGSTQGYFRPAGGRSLRIGQPEFIFSGTNNWATNSKRAIELIDLFTVRSTNSTNVVFPAQGGKINVNTAPKTVLEALFYNIQLASDPAAGNATISLTNASALADITISNRPYSRLSDLYKVLPAIASGTNFTPIVPTQVGGGTTNLALLDRAREETFGKFVEQTTTQSRGFRVYAVGQALDERTGKVLAQRFQEVAISLDSQSTNAVMSKYYLRNE